MIKLGSKALVGYKEQHFRTLLGGEEEENPPEAVLKKGVDGIHTGAQTTTM